MLLHQVIVVLISAAKRFDSVLLAIPSAVRRLIARDKLGGSDMQET